MRESIQKATKRSLLIFETLKQHYPPTTTFLNHKNPFELLIAVILSAQCTDERVNMVTPRLFETFPTPEALGAGDLDDIKDCIKSINFFNNKAVNIKETGQRLVDDFNHVVPNTLDHLISLPGVGRKTANVILGQAFQIPGITVDTHVKRLSNRLGFTKHQDANKAEQDLIKKWPDSIWIDMSTLLILHGRSTCIARKPQCNMCIIRDYCPSSTE